MKPEELKRKSRGASTDMSPQAISKRFEILTELYETEKALARAVLIGRPSGDRSGKRPL